MLRYYNLVFSFVVVLTASQISSQLPLNKEEQYSFIEACKTGNFDKVVSILADPKVDPSARLNSCLLDASLNGHTEIVRLLLGDPRLEPSNRCLALASKRGRNEVVIFLLEDSRIDPAFSENECIRNASQRGHVEVVRLLIRDSRVDPSAKSNAAIRNASDAGHTKTVKLLLDDPRVDPSAHDNSCIEFACLRNHIEVVKVLLNDPRVDPGTMNHFCIIKSSELGRTEMVRLLLSNPRVDPSAGYNESIRVASTKGHAGVVKLLLSDPRVDPEEIVDAEGLGLEDFVGMVLLVRTGQYHGLPTYISVNDLDILIGNCRDQTETAQHLRHLQLTWIKLLHPFEVSPGHFCNCLQSTQDEKESIRRFFWPVVVEVVPLLEHLKPVATRILERAVFLLVNLGLYGGFREVLPIVLKSI